MHFLSRPSRLLVFIVLTVVYLPLFGSTCRERVLYETPTSKSSHLGEIERRARQLLDRPEANMLKIVRFDSLNGSFFILPVSHQVLYAPPFSDRYMVGKGVYKKVYKGFLFTKEGKEKVAVGVGTSPTIVYESKLVKEIPFPESVKPFRAAFDLSRGRHVLVLKYYNKGSLRRNCSESNPFSRREKIKIARDVLACLLAMHRGQMAHRDLHDGNILLHECHDGTIKASIIDFGRSCYITKRKCDKPQGTAHRNPPEALITPFCEVDKQRSDLFAFGCFLYRLFLEEHYEIAYLYDCRKVHEMSLEKEIISTILSGKSMKKKPAMWLRDGMRQKAIMRPIGSFVMTLCSFSILTHINDSLLSWSIKISKAISIPYS